MPRIIVKRFHLVTGIAGGAAVVLILVLIIVGMLGPQPTYPVPDALPTPSPSITFTPDPAFIVGYFMMGSARGNCVRLYDVAIRAGASAGDAQDQVDGCTAHQRGLPKPDAQHAYAVPYDLGN